MRGCVICSAGAASNRKQVGSRLAAMKICHVVATLDPAGGGPPVVAPRLAAAQSQLGHDVLVTVLAVVTGIVCVVFLVLGRELQVYYHVYRLWSEDEYLGELIERPEGTPENTALIRFVKTETGRTRLAEAYIAEVSAMGPAAEYQKKLREADDAMATIGVMTGCKSSPPVASTC